MSRVRFPGLLNCFFAQVKTGPFAEHSNQLWNVSGVKTWDKVFTGLVKMYRNEVLAKFPVIQHVFFGSIFTLEESANPLPEVTVNAPRPQMPDVVGGFGTGRMPPMGMREWFEILAVYGFLIRIDFLQCRPRRDPQDVVTRPVFRDRT